MKIINPYSYARRLYFFMKSTIYLVNKSLKGWTFDHWHAGAFYVKEVSLKYKKILQLKHDCNLPFRVDG